MEQPKIEAGGENKTSKEAIQEALTYFQNRSKFDLSIIDGLIAGDVVSAIEALEEDIDRAETNVKFFEEEEMGTDAKESIKDVEALKNLKEKLESIS